MVLGNEAVASVFPIDLSGEVVALRACIDASGRNSGVFTVAGVAFGFDRAIKANREWQRLMDGRAFHMTDLNARKGDFEGISDTEKTRIVTGIVRILRSYASYAMAVSCDASIVSMPRSATPDPEASAMLSIFRSVYGYMCNTAMFAMANLVASHSNSSEPRISYIFEKGDDGQKGLIKYLDFLQNSTFADEILKEGYLLSRYTVTAKGEMEGIFHSSDFLAWEWSKHVEGLTSGRRMRQSLAAFLSPAADLVENGHGLTVCDGRRYFLRHFREDKIERNIGYYRDILKATSLEEYNAVVSRWEAYR